MMTLNYGHRGASGYYPENTMLAFEKAIEMGCDGIETDVQMTADGVLVLIHDENLKRTTGVDGWVKDYNFEDLRKLNAANYHSTHKEFQYIPTAEELLKLAKEKDIIINFEIKTGIVFYEGIEKKLIDLVNKYHMKHKVIISSFNHYALIECKKLDKEMRTAILYSEALYHPENYCETVDAQGLHPVLYAVNGNILEDAHEKGLFVQPYTVNDEETMKKFIHLGIDGIITNYPDKLKVLLDKNK